MRPTSFLRVLAFACLPVILPSASVAQWTVDPRIVTMYDDNLANNASQLTDWSTTFLVAPGYAFNGDSWDMRLFYDGAFKYFHALSDMSNQIHAGSAAASLYWGTDQEHTLDVTLTAGRGVFGGDFAFYDHTLAAASGQLKFFLAPTLIQTAAYQLRTVRFDDVGDLSYDEQSVSAGFRWAAIPGTTLILQADLGAKYYRTPLVIDTLGTRAPASTFFVPDVAQWTWMLRLGQSIVEGTGLSAMAKYQWNARKQSRFLLSSTGDISDDELFDDHYGYEGFHGNLMLTQVLSESMLARVTAGQQSRHYSSLAAYDLDGLLVADQRVDQRRYVSFFFQKTYERGFEFRAALDLIRNVSNDHYYDYRNTAVTVELALPL